MQILKLHLINVVGSCLKLANQNIIVISLATIFILTSQNVTILFFFFFFKL
jgi:hypothetical protein